MTAPSDKDDWRADGIYLHFLDDADTVSAQGSLCRLQLANRFDVVLVTERRAQEDVARMPSGMFPYVAVLHGSEILSYFSDLRAKLPVPRHRMEVFYENAKVCIAVSKATADLSRRLAPRTAQCVVVQNGIDPERLRKAAIEDVQALKKCRSEDAQIVFCLGRLDLDKGHDVLIRAFATVRRTCPNAYLLIGGVGPYRSDLESMCEVLQLQSCVEFTGEIPAAMLPAYFELSDVFVLTSKCERRWEGFGLVYLEAGYYGKPVIGGGEGGVPEAIAHMESGLLVDPRDSDAVADGIVKLLTDKGLAKRMGEKGRQRVVTHFNAKRMAQDTFQYLGSALQRSPAAGVRCIIKLRYWVGVCALRLFLTRWGPMPRRFWSR